ncbi:hypothetical protein HFO56_18520 [Rhizobium laguerreae]|uniref:hypothetical protein n=1 Tax=Rhizobium laguerreae TaxID=1076926 RepID=UPI001C90908E|nr:hypothetical protein [Rhizobium laguerreae]MBY3154335.1 hypothetical protein [Rhizobium laguerreae]
MKSQSFLGLMVVFVWSVAILQADAQAKDCATEMANKGYTGSKLFDETYKCQTGSYPKRSPNTVTKGTIPNDATLKRLQDTVKDNSD